MPVAKPRFPVVDCISHNCGLHSLQLETIEPATVGRSFTTGKRRKTIKQSEVFIRPSSHLSYYSTIKCSAATFIFRLYPFYTTYFIYQIGHIALIFRKRIGTIYTKPIKSHIGGWHSLRIIRCLKESSIFI